MWEFILIGVECSMNQQNYYSSMAKKVGFPYPRFLHIKNLESLPDEGLTKTLEKILYALRDDTKIQNIQAILLL